MAVVRLIADLLKDKALGPRVVPIVADEARTFGMASLFRQVGIYSPLGQLYEPEDASSMLSYREARDGQLLEEGITEAGALCSWTAAATVVQRARPRDAADVHLLLDVRLPARRRPDLGRGRPARARLPARRHRRPHDARRRRACSTRTAAATWSPRRCPTAAPTTRRSPTSSPSSSTTACAACSMQQEDEFYYVTVMNENYAHPSMPAGVEDDIVRGLYRLSTTRGRRTAQRRCGCSGSGSILREVIAAAALLDEDLRRRARRCYSVTSFSELARDAREVARANRLHPEQRAADQPRRTHARRVGAGRRGNRLRARVSRAHRRARRRAVHGARHRRLRPQRHARARCAASSRWIATTSSSRRCRRWRSAAMSRRAPLPRRSGRMASMPRRLRRGASDSPEQRRRPRNRIESRVAHAVCIACMCIAARPCRLAKSTFPSYCALKEPA